MEPDSCVQEAAVPLSMESLGGKTGHFRRERGQYSSICALRANMGMGGSINPESRQLQGGAANPPWSWNGHNDTSPIGEIATDPARFIIRYAQGWGPVSTHYICNPYHSV